MNSPSGSPSSHQSALDLLHTEWHRKMRLAMDAEAAALKDPTLVPEAHRLLEEALSAQRDRDLFESMTLTNPPGTFENDRYPTSDLGNAEVFEQLYGDVIRYDAIRARWLWWNHHRWTPLPEPILNRFAETTIRARRDEAFRNADPQKVKGIRALYDRLERDASLNAVVNRSKSRARITDTQGAWDTVPYLLGCRNGVVDLRTGDLHPGRPGDRITMSTGLDFDPSATCERWERFVKEVVPEDAVEWVQMVLGYAATGANDDHGIFILLGEGGTGKSVFLYGPRMALGGYAQIMQASFLLRSNGKNSLRDVARLENRRYVIASETNEGAAFDEALVKLVTGERETPGAGLYENQRDVRLVSKLFLSTNHPPRVSGGSDIKRRFYMIPFVNKFEGRGEDKQLLTKLAAERTGILTWIVEGARRWYSLQGKGGIDPMPSSCQAARDGYLAKVNPVTEFLESGWITAGDGLTVHAWELYQHYRTWAKMTGLQPWQILGMKRFFRSLNDLGRFERSESRNVVTYRGLCITLASDSTPE